MKTQILHDSRELWSWSLVWTQILCKGRGSPTRGGAVDVVDASSLGAFKLADELVPCRFEGLAVATPAERRAIRGRTVDEMALWITVAAAANTNTLTTERRT